MEIQALDHLVLRVADVDRCLRFYRGVLGLPVERLDAFRAGKVPFPSLRVAPDTIIDILPWRGAVEQATANVDHFCLVVNDLAAAQARLAQAGIPIEQGPAQRFGARGIATSIYVRDPDGNLVELRCYPGQSAGC